MTATEMLAPAAGRLPAHWHTAAMPEAALYRLEAGRLVCGAADAPIALTEALYASLPESASTATLAASGGGVLWRLRPVSTGAAPLWQLQSLDESRRLLGLRLRAVLASRLSTQILHDLRNPMNALSLHADLLARLLEVPQGVERAGGSLKVVRERLKDLSARQTEMVSLWLSPIDADVRELGLQPLIEDTLRMMRSHFSLRELRVHCAGLERLEGWPRVRFGARVRLVLIALLLLASDQALAETAGGPGAEMHVELSAGTQSPPELRIHTPWSPEALAGREWGRPQTAVAALIDELALLVDDAGVDLALADDRTSVAMRFLPQTPPSPSPATLQPG